MVEFRARLKQVKDDKEAIVNAQAAVGIEAERIKRLQAQAEINTERERKRKISEVINNFADKLKLDEKIAQIQNTFPEWNWTRPIPKPAGALSEDCSEIVGFENDITNPSKGGSALIEKNHLRYDKKVNYRFTRERWFIALIYVPQGNTHDQPVLRINNETFTPQEANEELLDDKLIDAIKSPLEIEVKSYIRTSSAGDYNG